jgi:hypothetical protein
MADNKQIKDGLGNVFTLRMRDISPLSDGSVQRSMILSSLYPLDYGAGGVFQLCAKSGIIPAQTFAPASPIYSFRWTPAGMTALVRRVKLVPWTLTAFSGGLASFDFVVARNFTAGDSGGTPANLGGDNNQLRTSMAASAAAIEWANTAALAPGTRTLDAAPLDTRTVVAPTVNSTMFPDEPIILFEKLQGEHPLYLAANEGFVINATVPQTNSTWQFTATVEWDEVQIF